MIYGFVISFSVALIINRINVWITFCPQLYPNSVKNSKDNYQNWKWRNFLISFIHAIITGFGSLFCVLREPQLLTDVTETYLEFGYILTSFSHGYFIYDTIEMVTNISYKGSKELVLHHTMILTCFSVTVIQRKYVGYSCIALLIELSNIFLHFRQLLLIANYSKASAIYRINSITNIVVFVIVRGLCLFWLWYTLFESLPKVPITSQWIAFTSLTGICLITLILAFRLIMSDFVRHNSHKNTNSKKLNCETNGKQLTKDQMIGDQMSTVIKSNGFVFKDNQQNNELRLRNNI